ncbi:hypothetical protein Hbor_33680 (plasmid) [Halogeometricum borinquense DSM 11551]|uniref:Uncharacterized protein n=1 Tax=Halogeometricum borinquense (strain ATCC 700274 / DSM 11551 / JCM 10706 / KCTC 4070 / PR3) TaxID=469382 RepID=E4NVK8_HALBP|nr:hypothetical protein Hbor_33680 [Halogeometricum borinquense DSM 11551]
MNWLSNGGLQRNEEDGVVGSQMSISYVACDGVAELLERYPKRQAES